METSYTNSEFLMGAELASHHIDSWLEYELLGDELVVDYLPQGLSRELQYMDWNKDKADTVADAVVFQVQTELNKFNSKQRTTYAVGLILDKLYNKR